MFKESLQVNSNTGVHTHVRCKQLGVHHVFTHFPFQEAE